MAELPDSAERAARLLHGARFMTLATCEADGAPWASTVNYVVSPGEGVVLVWYSMREARHSRNLAREGRVAATIFRTDLAPAQSPLGLDGLQLTGRAAAVDGDALERTHAQYYLSNFPDEAVRREWQLPLSQFCGEGPRRFYRLTVEAWWLLDIARWQRDKVDARLALPVPDRAWTPPEDGR